MNIFITFSFYFFRGSTEEVLKVLCSIMKGLTHESVDVRVNALHRLRYTLRHNQPAIHQLTTQSDNVHPTISELFSVILGKATYFSSLSSYNPQISFLLVCNHYKSVVSIYSNNNDNELLFIRSVSRGGGGGAADCCRVSWTSWCH